MVLVVGHRLLDFQAREFMLEFFFFFVLFSNDSPYGGLSLASSISSLWLLHHLLKSALSGLRPFLAIEIPVKMIKNAFYFTSKVLFVLKIFKILSWLFGHVAKQLDQKDKVNFKFYDVTVCLTNNCHAHIAQYPEK